MKRIYRKINILIHLLLFILFPIFTSSGQIFPPPQATLISPSGTITDSTPIYTWGAVPESSWYYLWVNDSTGNRIKQWYTAEQAGCSSGTGTCSVTHTTELAEGQAKWWIQTWNKAGYGPWSARMDFRIKKDDPSYVFPLH